MIKEKNIGESLRYIYDKFGIDTFQDRNKIYSILTDLSPSYKIEIGWVIETLNNDSMKPLLSAVKNNSNTESAKLKCIKNLKSNQLTATRIKYTINCFSYGLRLTDELKSLEEIEDAEIEDIEVEAEEIEDDEVEEGEVEADSKKREEDEKKKIGRIYLNKLKNNYNYLNSLVDDYIKNDVEKYIYPSDKNKSQISIVFNILGILLIGLIMVSCLFNIPKNIYKLDFVVLFVLAIMGINLVEAYFNNIKSVQAYGKKLNIYEGFKNNKNGIEVTLNYLNHKSILSKEEYDKYDKLSNSHKMEFDKYRNTWEKEYKNHNYKNVGNDYKIAALVVCIVLFIGLSVRETHLGSTFKIPVISNISQLVKTNIYKEDYFGYTTTDVNLRVKPKTDSDIIDVIKSESIVTLTGKNYENDSITWYEMTTEDGYGWVSGKVVYKVPKEVEVIAEAANVRKSYNLSSGVAGIVKKGDLLYTTGKAVDDGERIWYQVMYDSKKRWISANVLEKAD